MTGPVDHLIKLALLATTEQENNNNNVQHEEFKTTWSATLKE